MALPVPCSPFRRATRAALVMAFLVSCLLCAAPAFLPAAGTTGPRRAQEQAPKVQRRVIDKLTAPLPTDGEASKQDVLEASPWAVISQTEEYKEADRRARHVVYGYEDWVDHRSPDRYLRNLGSTFVSRVVKGVWFEVVFTMAISAVIYFLYDSDFTALGSVGNWIMESRASLKISNLPFALTSSLLSLLLVFKTNSAYGRWWEARGIWGAVTNKCRDVSRQIIARLKEKELRPYCAKLVVAFPFVLRFHLGKQTEKDKQDLAEKLEELVPPLEADIIMNATHKPMTTLGLVSDTLKSADLGEFDRMKMDEVMSALTDYYGMCERIFKTPMPIQYTRLTARFLSVWLLLLPFALHSQITPHWLAIPVTGLIAFFAFAIEDLSVQLEEPFSIQPLLAQANGIQASIFEALELENMRSELVGEHSKTRDAQRYVGML